LYQTTREKKAMNTINTLLNEYSNEMHITASSFFAWKSINNLAATGCASR
jgi:hypothetical protein